MRLCSALLLAFLTSITQAAFDSAQQVSDKPLSIVRFSPGIGDVEQRRQIVFTFDRDVVPLGRMERKAEEIPVTITPALSCQWRWLARNSLACLLDETHAMSFATHYVVVMRPGLISESGDTLNAEQTYQFTTLRPEVEYSQFRSWLAPDVPVIRLSFNQPVSMSSVQAALHFDDVAVKVSVDTESRESPLYFPLPGEKATLEVTAEQQTGDDQVKNMTHGEEARRNWLIQPVKPLGLDHSVSLRVRPGVVSASGDQPGTESRVVTEFATFPVFRFLGVRCQLRGSGNSFLITPAEAGGKSNAVSQSVQRLCAPLQRVELEFSSPVSVDAVKSTISVQPGLAGGRKDYDPWEEQYRPELLRSPHRRGQVYDVGFPVYLKAFQQYELHAKSGVLRDAFDRRYEPTIDFYFQTDHRENNVVFPDVDAVLEKQADSEVPIYVTNIVSLSQSYKTLKIKGGVTGFIDSLKKWVSLGEDVGAETTREVKMRKVNDLAFATPLGVREMLKGDSGIVAGYLSSSPDVNKTRFFAQVTPWQVHVKLGHFNSHVWVVDMATGLPVPDATVQIFSSKYNDLFNKPVVLAETKTAANGTAFLPGNEKLDPQLSLHTWRREDPHFFVRVQKERDLALLPLESTYQVDGSIYYGETNYASGEEGGDEEGGDGGEYYSNALWPNPQKRFHHIHSWGASAQGIYRVGDTIQYKIYVRDQDNNKFVPAPANGYKLEIFDPAGNSVDKREHLSLNEFSSLSGEYKIPASAFVGWYEFHLTAEFTNKTWQPLKVLVSDFTPASFHVSGELNGQMFKAGDEMVVQSHARLHAGGPYGDAETRVGVQLTPAALPIKDPALKGFYFDWFSGTQHQLMLQEVNEYLNSQGDHELRFRLPDTDIVSGALYVETSVRDDRGKSVANPQYARYVGRDRFIGLHAAAWVQQVGKPAHLSYAVINELGAMTAGASVSIDIQRLELKAARVKGAGNAYLTQYEKVWVAAGHCAALSQTTIATCDYTPAQAGELRIKATVTDSKGRKHSTQTSTWAVGTGYVLWESADNNSLPVVAEADHYSTGDKARLLVKNPYPGGTALITVERYGVRRQTVRTFERSTEMVEIPLLPDDVPGIFVSIMVTSKRVDKPLLDGQVDLGKPAFKMAYRRIDVIDPYKELLVDIKTDHEVYKPRSKALVDLVVTPRHGALTEKTELAIAVLDKSVFDLLAGGNKLYDPYRGFYSLDALDVENYDLLMRLVGRQKFEKKGADPGGDGGASLDMRTVFKYVSYWNPSLLVDTKGHARITVNLPDNLTGWRILAMAVTPGDQMGLGVHSFKVNKATEVRPVMPNQLTESDSFSAGFTVMNRSDVARKLHVHVKAEGPVKGKSELDTTLDAAPFARPVVWMPITTTGSGELKFTISASDTTDKDGLVYKLPVNKRRSLITVANYGTTTENLVHDSLQVPDAIYPDAGMVGMQVSPTVLGNLEGAFTYMADYPYWCWEQRLSKALMASAYTQLREHLHHDKPWSDATTLPQKMLDDAHLYQAPNGGMVFWIADDRYVSPYLSAYTALAFGDLQRAGYTIPKEVGDRLHAYLLTMLRQNVFPTFYSEGMASSVRAVALAALADKGELKSADLVRYQSALPQMDLFGKAHFLMAALKTAGNAPAVEAALQDILGHLNQSGGKAQFDERWDDSYSQLLATPMRSNCIILSALVLAGETPQWASRVNDLPFKMVRAITQTRGNREHWENTQENVFCMQALVNYSHVYEADKPDMHIKVTLDNKVLGENAFASVSDASVMHARALNGDDVGQHKDLQLQREGTGRVYYSSRLSYAEKAEQAELINAGIELRREYSVERGGTWELLKNPLMLKRGELVRVDLYVSAPTARHFVVVNDPVPGGFEPVNRDLATASKRDADKAEFKAAGGSWWFHYGDWSEYGVSYWNFYHKELRFDSARFYADYLPAGNYHLSYAAQVIAPGQFRGAPAHAEEMYDPDIFGNALPVNVSIMPADGANNAEKQTKTTP